MLTKFDNFYRLLSLLVLIPLLGDLQLGCAGLGGGGAGGGPLPDLNRDITTPQGVGGITAPGGGLPGGGGGGGGAAAPGWQDGQFPGRRPKEIFFEGKFCPSHPELKVEMWEKRGNEDWKPTTIDTHYNPSDGTFYSWIHRPGQDEIVSIKFRAFHSDCFAGETPEQLLPYVAKAYTGSFVLSNISQCVPSGLINLKRCLGTFPERFELAPDKLLDSSSEREADSPPNQAIPEQKLNAGSAEANLNNN